MRSVLVVIADIIGEQPLEMLLVESDHMIEQIASATLYPALGDAVLPRTLVGLLIRIDLHGSYSNWDFQAIFRVTIKDEELLELCRMEMLLVTGGRSTYSSDAA
jgi:hypothetical protein